MVKCVSIRNMVALKNLYQRLRQVFRSEGYKYCHRSLYAGSLLSTMQ